MALNIERDTRPNPKNRIPKPPKVVHDDVTVMSKSLFRSLFGRFLVAFLSRESGQRQERGTFETKQLYNTER